MSDALTTALTGLAIARSEEARLKAELAEKRAAFDIANSSLIIGAKSASEMIATLEADVRALTLSAYEQNGDRRPALGVEVKVQTRYEYDSGEAFVKAKAMGVAIVPESLDAKAFEKIVKASPESFPFVRIVTEPTAQIGRDLSAYLASEEVGA